MKGAGRGLVKAGRQMEKTREELITVVAMVELMRGTMEEMMVGGAMEEVMVKGFREWTANKIPEQPRR